MKVYREAAFIGNDGALCAFINTLRTNPPAGWTPQPIDPTTKNPGVFDCARTEETPAFRLVLSIRNGRCSIVNIVPLETNHFDMDEYNEIVDAVMPVLEPYAATAALTTEELSPETDLTRWITQDAIDRLTSYSNNANRSIPHPFDQERWREFILQLFADGRDLPLDIFERYMVEELGWSEEAADKHALQLEFALDLLKHATQGSRRFPARFSQS